MRNVRACLIALVLTGLAVPAAGQSDELPEYSVEQRWNRAATHATLGFVLMLRGGQEQGKTATDVAGDMATLFGPGWNRSTTPIAMARAIRFNWLLWPDALWELLEDSDARVRFRMNRPWRAQFGEAGVTLGVAESDFGTFLRVFHERIAAQRGMAFSQTEAGDWLEVTIERR